MTGHWIEEPHSGIWELHSALFGFVRLNNAHNGKRLGGALFKIIDRLGIAHKVHTHYQFMTQLKLNRLDTLHATMLLITTL